MASRAHNDDYNAHASREWFTASELAELALPGMPGDKRSINRRVDKERWTRRTGADGELLVRASERRRGGGLEFHVSLLPGEARLELARRGVCAAAPLAEAPAAIGGAWQWLEAQPEKTRIEAQRRAGIVAEVELLEESGMTRTAAIATVSSRHEKAKPATLWGWLRAVGGVAPSDRLPALAPQYKGGGREADIDGWVWNLFKSDYLRPECPTLTSCFDRTAKAAALRDISIPTEATFRRRLKEIDPSVLLFARSGAEKAARSIPDNRRTLDGLHAMDLVNIDGHQFDVFVTAPEGGRTVRPVLIAIQDVWSRKLVAWRLDLSENVLATRLAFADLFERFGIPNQCLLDNSRTFASKALTEGAATRYRGKIKDEAPAGLLVSLGIKVRFAQIYHGQSKPIERAFRDLADRIARHPACAGAYTGNSPVNKPANYGKRAVPWAEFEQIVAQGIADHNARLGRRTETARGRSFDETFAGSYATATIRKAGPEQLRMALLAAEQKRVNRRTGEIELYGNRYWAPECGRYLGELVTVRFHPDNLHREIHLYGRDGAYLARAELIQDFGFAEQAGAIAAGKRRKDAMRRMRDGLAAERLLAADAVADLQVPVAEPEIPAASVVRAVRPVMTTRGAAAAALRVADPIINDNRESQARVIDAVARFVSSDE